MKTPIVSLIVAATAEKRVIGKGLEIPWPRLKEDMKNFRQQTIPHPYISGRKTFETLRDKTGNHAPLADRLNIVVTRDTGYKTFPEVLVVHSLEEAIELASETSPEKIFIGGGEQIYRQALGYVGEVHHPHRCIVDEIFFTEIDLPELEGDIFFPEIPACFTLHGQDHYEQVVKIGEDDQPFTYRIKHFVRD